jgi:20S proteasome alpha/beta subunit
MAHQLTSYLLFIAAALVHASRYANYEYDLTTPQFTPDGRLLQVEYATNALIREGSNPILSMGFSDHDDALLIMASVSSTAEMAHDHQPNSNEEISNEVHQRAQYRIIEVPISASYNHFETINPQKVVSGITSSTILVGLSGHLSDATSLLQTIYSQLEEEQSVFGWHRLGLSPVGQDMGDASSQSESTTSEIAIRLARVAADQCQKHAFGGGLRPIGATLLVCGVDQQQNGNGRLAICKTDPSGGIQSLVYNMSHDIHWPREKVMIAGGSLKSQSKLRSSIESRLKELHRDDSNSSSTDNYTRKVIQAAVLSLLEEWKSRQDSQHASPLSKLFQQVSKASKSVPLMEVVLVSSKMGSFRLSDNDISRLLKQHIKSNE